MPRITRLKNSITCVVAVSIGIIRYVRYWINDQSPEILELDIADQVLINDRVMRIRYACAHVTRVSVKGIACSWKHVDVLTVEIPAGMHAIEIIFRGYGGKITERRTLTFLNAEVLRANFQMTLRKPAQPLAVHLRAVLQPFALLRVPHGQLTHPYALRSRRVVKHEPKIAIPFPENIKSNDQ